ncbi:CASP-like protein 4D1 [Linum grandiflorum]
MASSSSQSPASRAIVLVLRLSTLFLLVAAVFVLVFDKAEVRIDLRNFDVVATKLTFKDLITFIYLIGVGIVVAIYTVIQVPFSIYHVATGKRLSCFPEFDFYADKIVSYLLATAVGAGFLVCAELKTNLNKMLKSLEESNTQGLGDSKEKYDRFINHGFLASALVLFAFICMAVVSVLSSLNRNSNEKKSIFG